MALDKVLPGRDFLQAITVPSTDSLSNDLTYDVEWLCVLKRTHHLLSTDSNTVTMPSRMCEVTPEEIAEMRENILLHNNNTLNIPPCPDNYYSVDRGGCVGNSQTDHLLKIIERHHIWTIPSETSTNTNMGVLNPSASTVSATIATSDQGSASVSELNDPNAIDID